MDISLEKAWRLIEASHAKAAELGIGISTAVVDDGGHLVALGRMDGARWTTPHLALGKAFTAAAFRRPSSYVEENLMNRPIFQSLRIQWGALLVPSKGGMPIVQDGQVVGGIGVSGGSGEEDDVCAEAALAAIA